MLTFSFKKWCILITVGSTCTLDHWHLSTSSLILTFRTSFFVLFIFGSFAVLVFLYAHFGYSGFISNNPPFLEGVHRIGHEGFCFNRFVPNPN